MIFNNNHFEFLPFLLHLCALYCKTGCCVLQSTNNNHTQKYTVLFAVHSLNTVKTVLSGHSKIVKTKFLMTNGSIMKVESVAECSHWSILQYFWPAFKDNRCWKPILFFFLSGCLRQGLQHCLPPPLTLCMLGSCFCFRLLTLFFKLNSLKTLFQRHYQSVKRFGSRSGPTFCRIDTVCKGYQQTMCLIQ